MSNGLLNGGGQELLPPVVATGPPSGTYVNGSDRLSCQARRRPPSRCMRMRRSSNSNSSSSSNNNSSSNKVPPLPLRRRRTPRRTKGYQLSTMQAHQAQAHGLTHSGLQVFTLGHLMPKSAVGEDEGPGGPGGEQGAGDVVARPAAAAATSAGEPAEHRDDDVDLRRRRPIADLLARRRLPADLLCRRGPFERWWGVVIERRGGPGVAPGQREAAGAAEHVRARVGGPAARAAGGRRCGEQAAVEQVPAGVWVHDRRRGRRGRRGEQDELGEVRFGAHGGYLFSSLFLKDRKFDFCAHRTL